MPELARELSHDFKTLELGFLQRLGVASAEKGSRTFTGAILIELDRRGANDVISHILSGLSSKERRFYRKTFAV
ncbi:hypothetical protein IJ380_02860 [Candidatus Saccharibacteria bacterium]|nr:hypothetical protein [Candidatus Saccharibacteria bacterium]